MPASRCRSPTRPWSRTEPAPRWRPSRGSRVAGDSDQVRPGEARGSLHLAPPAAGLSHMALDGCDTAGPYGSRRAASGAPHHEGLRFAAKQDLILRSPPKAGVSKDGPRRDCESRSTAYAIALPWRGRVGSHERSEM